MGGFAPPPFKRVSRAPGAGQTPKLDHFRTPGPPGGSQKPQKNTGIDPRRAPDRWISGGGIVFEPTPAATGTFCSLPPGPTKASLVLQKFPLLFLDRPESAYLLKEGGAGAGSLFLQATLADCKYSESNKGATLCYAIVLPSRKSGFRAGFRPDSNRESLKSSPPAGRRPAGLKQRPQRPDRAAEPGLVPPRRHHPFGSAHSNAKPTCLFSVEATPRRVAPVKLTT